MVTEIIIDATISIRMDEPLARSARFLVNVWPDRWWRCWDESRFRADRKFSNYIARKVCLLEIFPRSRLDVMLKLNSFMHTLFALRNGQCSAGELVMTRDLRFGRVVTLNRAGIVVSPPHDGWGEVLPSLPVLTSHISPLFFPALYISWGTTPKNSFPWTILNQNFLILLKGTSAWEKRARHVCLLSGIPGRTCGCQNAAQDSPC